MTSTANCVTCGPASAPLSTAVTIGVQRAGDVREGIQNAPLLNVSGTDTAARLCFIVTEIDCVLATVPGGQVRSCIVAAIVRVGPGLGPVHDAFGRPGPDAALSHELSWTVKKNVPGKEKRATMTPCTCGFRARYPSPELELRRVVVYVLAIGETEGAMLSIAGETRNADKVESTMNRRLSEGVLRAAVFSGLGTSALLVAEYRDPILCTADGGCGVVRNSPYAAPFGIPLPLIGVLFFLIALCAIAIPRARRRLLLPLSLAGSVAGLSYLAIQAFVLHAFCPMCLVVDVSALLLGVTAFSARGAAPAPLRLQGAAAHLVAAVAVTGGALGWHAHLAGAHVEARSEVPPVVLREQRPGRVTVVEFVDFECPACRAQYGQFSSVLASYADRVNVVVKQMPLPQHEHALDAARAYCCAADRDKAAEMADRLFKAQHLGREDCEEIAVSLGLDRNEFRSCVDSERIANRLRADTKEATSAGIHGLPTLWIGQERFEGVHERAVLEASIERALRHPTPS